MNKRHSFPAVLLVLIFISCGAEKEYEPEFNYQGVNANAVKPQSVIADSLFKRTNNSISAGTPAASATPAVSTAAAGAVNPPHGQPGHRCELAVGAPLNAPVPASVPTTPVAAAKAQQLVTQTPVVANPNQKVAPGMNPAHGQPGHRCDIAVGAPLNSKPVTPAAAKTTTTATTNKPAQKVAPGMNPEHGQPGHRCDIGVGQPLNSKPKSAAAAAQPATAAPAPVMAPALVPAAAATDSSH